MAKKTPGARRRWPRRILEFVVLGLLGAWALYLVAMNVFLRTRLFRNLISFDPVSLRVEYATAHSFVPGRIHVEGLQIRGSDSNVQWILVLDRCDFRVSFHELARKRFHASDVHGDGLSFRVRMRQPSFSADEAAALPPVPGFSDPPYPVPKPPPTPPDQLWSIWLEGVFAEHVREIWVQTLRASGDYDVHGRWYFEPTRWLDIGPAALDLRKLDVSYGEHETWVADARGKLEVTLHPSDVRTYDGAQVLRDVSIHGGVAGTAHAAAPIDHLSRGHGVDVERADFPIDVGVFVDHGVLKPGTTVRAEASPVSARALDLHWTGTVGLEASVGADGTGHARIDAGPISAAQPGFTRGTLHKLEGTLVTRELDLTRPFEDVRWSAGIEDARTESLRYWMGLAKIGSSAHLALDSGPARIDARASGTRDASTLEGSAHARVEALTVEREPLRASAGVEATIEGRVQRSSSGSVQRVTLTKARLELEDASVTDRGAVAHVPRVSMSAPGSLAWTPEGLQGRVVVDAPIIQVPSAERLAKLLPMPPKVGLAGGRAQGSLHTSLDLARRTVDGHVHVAIHDVTVRAGDQRLRGNMDVLVQARAEGETTDVSGTTVLFREARDEAKPLRDEDPWWASAELQQAHLVLDGGPRLQARVVARARDAGPIATLVEGEVSLPAKLAMGLVSTRGVAATGTVVLAPSLLEARSVRVQAEGFDLALELRTLGTSQDAAVFVKSGPVQVGIDVARAGTSVYLFGAEPWYAQRVAMIRAAEARSE
jgi:hypothetical protein